MDDSSCGLCRVVHRLASYMVGMIKKLGRSLCLRSLLKFIEEQQSKSYSKQGEDLVRFCKLLKPCVCRSGVYNVMKCLRETGSTLPNVRSTLSQRERKLNVIKKTQEKNQKK